MAVVYHIAEAMATGAAKHHMRVMSSSPGRDLVPVDPEKLERDKARVERGFWPKVRRTLGRVPFIEEAIAAYFCAMDPRTPLQVKAILLGALAYFVMPADMIPDFIAWLGFTDDAMVLAAAVRSVAPAIKEHHRQQARDLLDQEDPAGPAA